MGEYTYKAWVFTRLLALKSSRSMIAADLCLIRE